MGFVWFLVDLGLLDLCYLCCGFGFGSCCGVVGFVFGFVVVVPPLMLEDSGKQILILDIL